MMIKPKRKSFVFEPGLTPAQNYARYINEYWRRDVAVPDGFWNVQSEMKNGVPLDAFTDRTFHHPDVIYVHRVTDRIWSVTRDE